MKFSELVNSFVVSITNFFSRSDKTIQVLQDGLFSAYLNYNVELIVFLPPGFSRKKTYPVLLFNDGQDLARMNFKDVIENAFEQKKIADHVVVGIVPKDRIAEYGTVSLKDYKNRGEKSGDYHNFLFKELFPFLTEKYQVSEQEYQHSIAGFSLGGLSAIYIAWQYPQYFKSVGVFSGALWWRSKDFDPKDPDADRVMHTIVENSKKRDKLKLWFQAGTKDEEEDRNNNGVIDAIDDTLHLIEALEKIGYRDNEVRYLEIQDGEHEPITWGKAMPDFLGWGLKL